jgi:hypothetical protein
MNTFPSSNSLSVSVHVYRALLVAYPKKFREHYETQMIQVFRDSFRYEYHRNGIFGVIDLWLHTFADLLVTALIERLMAGSRYMFSPKVTLWGGVAGLFSGMLWMMTGLAPLSGATTMVLALVLGLGGLVSLYSRQSGQGGKLGLAGLVLGLLGSGTAIVFLCCWSFTFGRLSPSTIRTDPELAAPGILLLALAMMTAGMGPASLGIASLRAKTLPRWQGLPLGLGLLNFIEGVILWFFYYVPMSQGRNPFDPWPPQGYIFHVVVLVLLGLGWMSLGLKLADEAVKVTQPPPASA